MLTYFQVLGLITVALYCSILQGTICNTVSNQEPNQKAKAKVKAETDEHITPVLYNRPGRQITAGLQNRKQPPSV